MIFTSTTNVGLARKENQDFLGNLETERGHFFIVSDGLGGLPNGALASKTAVNTIFDMFSLPFSNPIEYLEQAIEDAHTAVTNADPGLLGTTVVAVYYEKGTVHAAWCGDSRIYHFTKHSIDWISRDHNVLHDVLNRGHGRRDLFFNPQAITRYLGQDDNHKPDVYKFSVKSGERILICSDGLSNFILEPDIVEAVTGHDCKNGSDMLEDMLLSKEIGAPDNFTWYIIKI